MFHKHHILAQKFADHPVVEFLAGRFAQDAVANLMALPSAQAIATDLSSSPHTGGHLGTYYNGFSDYLDSVQRSERFLAAVAGDSRALDEVASDVNGLVAAAKFALANGHLFANTPKGMTAEKANAENQRWFDNWREYAADNVAKIQQMQETVDQLYNAGQRDAALSWPLHSPTSILDLAKRIEIFKRSGDGSPISLQSTVVGPVPGLPGLVPPVVDTRLPGFFPPPLRDLSQPEGFTPSNPLLSHGLPGFPAANPQAFGPLPPTTAIPQDPLVLQYDLPTGMLLPYYENPWAGDTSAARDVLPWLLGGAAVGLAAPSILPWLLGVGGILAFTRAATAQQSSSGATTGAATPAGGVFSTGAPAHNTLSNGLSVHNAAGARGASASSTLGSQLGGASSFDPEPPASTFADRFGNWASTAASTMPTKDLPEAAPTPAAGSLSPEDVRRLTRVNEANAGSVFSSGSAPVPYLPPTEFNERFGSWTVPSADGQHPQPSKPIGTFADEPSYLIPPPIFGVDGPGNLHNDGEEWFSRWIRPLLRPE